MKKGENVHQRKDGRWEARYIKERAPSGKIVYGFCYGASREEALGKAKETQKPDSRPIAEFLDGWLEECGTRVKASTLENYRTAAEKYLKPRLGDKYPDELDRKALEHFKQELLEEDKLSASRIQTVLLVLRSVLRYARQDCPQFDETARVSYPSMPRQAARLLTEEEQLQLTTCLQLEMDACKFGILLVLSTGLRVGELCALRWGDISVSDRTLQVSATMQRLRQADGQTQVIVSGPRSAASERTIPLTERTAGMCGRMYTGDPSAYVLTGTRRPMEPRMAQRRLKKYKDFCGLKEVSFNTLRDTFAARCVESGMDPGSLCEIMGYSSVRLIPPAILQTSMSRKRTGVRLLEKAGF